MTSVPEFVRLAGLVDAGVPAEPLAEPSVGAPALDGPPEAALALARLHLRGHARSWPDWRSAALPVPVRVAWLTAEIARRRVGVRDEPAGDLLCRAVRALPAADADDPEALVRDLAGSPDPVLRGEAVRIARDALHAALLPPRTVREVMAGLAAVEPAALRELAEPWAVLDPLPHGTVRRWIEGGSADAAIDVAARHGHRDLLRDVAADPARTPALRRRALELLGDLADRDDVDALLSIAVQDPPLLAGPAVECLGGLHRRGHFVAGRHVPAIIGLALADRRVPAADVAAILYPCRHEALRDLTATGPWPRRLALLVALAAQGAPGLGAAAAVARLARRATDPRPFLRALRDLRDPAAEETVLALLPDAPRDALDALEAVGGPRTADALWTALGLDGGDVARHLSPFRGRALEILWHLNRDPGRRRALLDRLDPHRLPRRIADDLGGPDSRELAVLRAAPDPDDPEEALGRLARNGDATTLPAIADLLLRVVSGLTASWTPGDPGPEPAVPDGVLTAIRDLGARLYRRGAIRPRPLLDADAPPAAGDAVLAGLVLDLLDRPGLVPAERTILLTVLRGAPYARTRARVHPLLRHRDPHVRDHAIALFTTDAAGARVLSASLVPLLSAGDPPTVRQALLALAEARATWASAAIAGRLDHPNMNVKKTAAAALAVAGGPSAVPKILFWLGNHDNPGLRENLAKALHAILGDASGAVLLAAADEAPTDRARTLLQAALQHSARTAGSVSEALPVRRTVVEARFAATVRAAAGLSAEDEPRISGERSGGDGTTGSLVEAERAVRALTEHGWDAAIAVRVLDTWTHVDVVCPELRRMLPRWLDLAVSDPRALRLAVDLCSSPRTATEVEVFARSGALLVDALLLDEAPREGDGAIGRRGARRRLVELLREVAPRLGAAERYRAVQRVRAMPASTASITVLELCGAVVTRDDLERALAAARGSAEQEAVLREAFGQDAADGEDGFRVALTGAVREPESVRRLRNGTEAAGPEVLDALIRAFPDAVEEAKTVLLDWMEAVRPLGTDRPPSDDRHDEPAPRTPEYDDLDQPPSEAQWRRLAAMLDGGSAEQRARAARALLGWPGPEGPRAVLRAFLDGRVDMPSTWELAPLLLEEPEVPEGGERFVRLARHLRTEDLDRFVPMLVACWERGDGEAWQALRQASADIVAEAIAGRLVDGAWGLLDLVKDRELIRTASLERALARLREECRDDVADAIVLVDGPLRAPGAAEGDAATLAALREHVPVAVAEPSRADLFRAARSGAPKEVRQALARLAELEPGDGDGLEALLGELIVHRETKVRLHAHRVARRVLGRAAYLDLTVRLLDDPEPEVVRAAIRTLGHAGWAAAVPGLVGLLAHPRPQVRRAAEDGLVRIGEPAVPALRHAAARARPDRRPRYTAPLAKINDAGA